MVRAGSFLSASYFPLLPFSLFPQVYIPCSHFPPFLVRSITRCDCASETVTFQTADLCAHPVFPLDTCQSYLTFVFSAWCPRCCQKSLNSFCCDSKIFVNPAWSVILTHCHFDFALLPPWPELYALCFLFAPFLFVRLLIRFRFIIITKDLFPAEL